MMIAFVIMMAKCYNTMTVKKKNKYFKCIIITINNYRVCNKANKETYKKKKTKRCTGVVRQTLKVEVKQNGSVVA